MSPAHKWQSCLVSASILFTTSLCCENYCSNIVSKKSEGQNNPSIFFKVDNILNVEKFWNKYKSQSFSIFDLSISKEIKHYRCSWSLPHTIPNPIPFPLPRHVLSEIDIYPLPACFMLSLLYIHKQNINT